MIEILKVFATGVAWLIFVLALGGGITWAGITWPAAVGSALCVLAFVGLALFIGAFARHHI